MKKLAFLFLTYDNLKQIKVWENYFNGADKEQYTIYVHSKNPSQVSDSILRGRQIKKLVSTKWGDISLVNATINLLEEAYMNPDNMFFILVSDSCIPITTFNEFYNFLMEQDQSYILAYDSNKERYDEILDKTFISRENFKKQHQWMILNRSATHLIIITRQHTSIFSKMFAPDEHYFVNVLLHYEQPFINKLITYTDWRNSTEHPKTFTIVDDSLIIELRKHGFYFLRKIDRNTDMKFMIVNWQIPVYVYSIGIVSFILILQFIIKFFVPKRHK
jgi:hypothetical protein